MQKLEFDQYDFEIKEVSGVKIYYKKMPFVQSVNVRWGVNVGAAYDPIGKEGTAHFLEHVLFCGNPMFDSEIELDNFGRKYLLHKNAYTGFHDTVFTCSFLPKNMERAIDAAYNILYQPFMRDKDIEHERQVIIQEMWGVLVNPTKISYLKEFNANIYYDFEYLTRMYSPGGWPDTVEKINKDDLKSIHQHYTKENTFIIVTGNITDELLQKISEAIEKIPNGVKLEKQKVPDSISPIKNKMMTKTYTEIGSSEKKQTTLSVGRVLPKDTLKTGKLIIIRGFLRTILDRKLRKENAWCYSADLDLGITHTYMGIGVSVKTDPKNTEDALKIIDEAIEEIKAGKYKEEFADNKQRILDTNLADEPTSDGIADGAESRLTRHGEILTIQDMLDEMEIVEYDDVVNFLAKEFKREDVGVEIIKPSEVGE